MRYRISDLLNERNSITGFFYRISGLQIPQFLLPSELAIYTSGIDT